MCVSPCRRCPTSAFIRRYVPPWWSDRRSTTIIQAITGRRMATATVVTPAAGMVITVMIGIIVMIGMIAMTSAVLMVILAADTATVAVAGKTAHIASHESRNESFGFRALACLFSIPLPT